MKGWNLMFQPFFNLFQESQSQIKTADTLITIDVNNLPAGNYVVSAIGNNNIITGNFMKL